MSNTTLTLFTEWTGLLQKNPPHQFCFPMFTFLLTTRQTLSHVVGYFVVVILHMDTLSTQTTHMHFPSTHSSILSVKLYSIQKSQAIHMQHLNNCNYINVRYTWVMQYAVIIFLCLHILFFLELTSTFLLLMVILFMYLSQILILLFEFLINILDILSISSFGDNFLSQGLLTH